MFARANALKSILRTVARPDVARRSFSVISIHSTIPTILLRLQCQPQSALFDYAGKDPAEVDPEDGVTVAEDGLVYPKVSHDEPSLSSQNTNGVGMMPNTFLMQEIVRNTVDWYHEGLVDGLPLIYRVAKGAPVPPRLILIQDRLSHFSLQPSVPMPLDVLNQTLDSFYEKHAQRMTAEEWLDDHPFEEAVPTVDVTDLAHVP
ncbi:MAG: hypothetical protein M4579_004084 [Chaenotheca gracillima]|nr:MAG: hypothetical protein M4579_004084 [Chaenotheca gracillima]